MTLRHSLLRGRIKVGGNPSCPPPPFPSPIKGEGNHYYFRPSLTLNSELLTFLLFIFFSLSDNLLSQLSRDFLIMRKLHGKCPSSTRHGIKIRSVFQHLRHRPIGLNRLIVPLCIDI